MLVLYFLKFKRRIWLNINKGIIGLIIFLSSMLQKICCLPLEFICNLKPRALAFSRAWTNHLTLFPDPCNNSHPLPTEEMSGRRQELKEEISIYEVLWQCRAHVTYPFGSLCFLFPQSSAFWKEMRIQLDTVNFPEDLVAYPETIFCKILSDQMRNLYHSLVFI